MRTFYSLGAALLLGTSAMAHAQEMSGGSSTTPQASDVPAPPAPATDLPTTPDPGSDVPASSTPSPAPAAPGSSDVPPSAYMATPAPAAAPSAPVAAADDYPLCTKSITDHCMNPGEAPKGYAKKHRPK